MQLRQDTLITESKVEFSSFDEKAREKSIYIVSVNLEGIGLSKRLTALGFSVSAFVDTRFAGLTRHAIKVIDLDPFLKVADPKSHIIIIATKDRTWKKKLLSDLECAGFTPRKNLFTAADLCKFYPTIEIAGKCNLKCATCDMALPGANSGRSYMSKNVFEKVLQKMLTEIPLMNSVALYTWGEPLLNPEISDIIKLCHQYGVASEVSSNLDYHLYLDEFILSEPDQIVAPCAGINEKYERGRTGGSWKNYLSALYRIHELKCDHKLDINVRIMYHLYRDNLGDDYEYMSKLSEDLGFTFIPILAHLFPGQVLKYALGKGEIPEIMKKAEENLLYSIDDQLNYSLANKNRPCHIINAFPTVTWDTKVLHCCNMQDPLITNYSYLEKPLSYFIDHRNSSLFCTECANVGVHRYFDVNVKIENNSSGRQVIRL